MNSLMKKLAIVILGSSLLGSMPIQALSNKKVAFHSLGIATFATFILTLESSLYGLYKGAQYFFQKDPDKKEKNLQSAKKAFLIASASLATSALILPRIVKQFFSAKEFKQFLLEMNNHGKKIIEKF